ncbi:carbonic anhydrase [Desulfurobacterium atlanticum]|uniref:carbonic anhydrase n=1 Tax=Desulfurobacterium atlanticum TaxID=240169 RepID=A0A238ZX23_9BACT|nr:carbonic anhydrase [Desulfurobacterium atlanticum]SNR87809.1 carbonic anhydrase [Desulfurobacterium atlanticum]
MEQNSKELIKEILLTNDRFLKGKSRDFFKEHINSQAPKITLVTCSDSRVQTEIFTEDAINKVFIIRNIGNQIENNLGSVDYGVLHLKTPILFILGHTNCGAIKTFISGYENENHSIRYELDHLHIPLKEITKNKGDIQKAIEENIHWQVGIAVKRYKTLIENKELSVLGGIYDFGNYYNKGFGRIVIININGEKERESIKENLTKQDIPAELLEKITI